MMASADENLQKLVATFVIQPWILIVCILYHMTKSNLFKFGNEMAFYWCQTHVRLYECDRKSIHKENSTTLTKFGGWSFHMLYTLGSYYLILC